MWLPTIMTLLTTVLQAAPKAYAAHHTCSWIVGPNNKPDALGFEQYCIAEKDMWNRYRCTAESCPRKKGSARNKKNTRCAGDKVADWDVLRPKILEFGER